MIMERTAYKYNGAFHHDGITVAGRFMTKNKMTPKTRLSCTPLVLLVLAMLESYTSAEN
jgi:hypothetical protein